MDTHEEDIGAAPQTHGAPKIPLALLGAAVGALIGAGLWAGVAVATEREFGLLAIAVGALAGLGAKLGGRSVGTPLQLIAVIWALLGLLIAKYLIVAGVMSSLAEQNGVEMGWFDPRVFEGFKAMFTEMMGIYDLVWLALAVGAAWSVPANRGD